MKKNLIKILACAISTVLMTTAFIGCGSSESLEGALENRPDYSNSEKECTIWAYDASPSDWYQCNNVRYYLDEMVTSPETLQLYVDGNFNMFFINYAVQYNSFASDFEGSDMEKIMDMAHEKGLPCFVYNQVIHSLSGADSTKDPIIDTARAVKSLKTIADSEGYSREYFFGYDDYCYNQGHASNCDQCTAEKLPETVKEKIDSKKAVNEICSSAMSNNARNAFYNEDDLDGYIELALDGVQHHPAFRGVSLKDEPFWQYVPSVGIVYRSLVRVLNNDENPANDNPYVMMNMLPYNTADYHKAYFAKDGLSMSSKDAYMSYLDLVYEHVSQYCGYFMYDDYPILVDNGVLGTYLEAQQMISDFCKEHNLERRMVMQSTSYSNRTVPKGADMYWQGSMAMAFGTNDYSYYTYYPYLNTDNSTRPDEDNHIVKHNGDPNEVYYDVKAVNAELRFNSKAMLNFKYQGMTYKAKAPMPGGMGYVNNMNINTMTKLVDYDFSVNVQAGGMVLITEFYDAEKNQYGYCVVNGTNPAYTSEVVVTLDFGSMQNAQIYQNLNISNVKAKEGKVTINLGTGRSAFVMPY